MTSKIILKKSVVENRVPVVSDLEYGELALNYKDGRLYYKRSDGVSSSNDSVDYFVSGSLQDTNTTYTLDGSGTTNSVNLELIAGGSGSGTDTINLVGSGVTSLSWDENSQRITVSSVGGTFTEKTTFPSAVASRPQLPGGFLGLDTGDGNFDIWGISRDYYPSHPTAGDAWGVLWNGASNEIRFIGAGNTRLSVDLDGEADGLKWNNNTVLHAGNYNSYRGTQLTSPNGTTVVAADNALPDSGHSFIHTLALGPGGNDGHILGMTWANTASVYGAQLFIDTDPTNTMAFRSRSSVGTWTNWNTVLHSNNYTSYSPSLTGTGASGTWGINITGNAATASNSSTLGGLTKAQLFNNMGNNHNTYTDFNNIPDFGTYYVQAGTNSPTGVGAHQWYGFTLGLGNDYSLSSYGTQLYWPRAAQNSDTYLWVRDREGGSWGSWRKILAGYADTAGSATDSTKLPLSGGTMTGTIVGVSGTTLGFDGGSSAADSYNYVFAAGNDSGNKLVAFVNGSARSNDGGTNSVTIRNDGGALNLGNSSYSVNLIGTGVYAPILYDSNDTSYYVDPASTSTSLNLAGYAYIGKGIVSGQYLTLNHDQLWAQGTLHFQYSSAGNIDMNYGGGYTFSRTSLRAPVFYDSNDTSYYVDPNSTSRLYGLTVVNSFDTTSNDVYANMRVIRSGGSDGMYIGYSNNNSGITRIFGGGSSGGALEKYSDYSYEPGSFRAPIFYDSNNTAYYADPASTSVFNQLTVDGDPVVTKTQSGSDFPNGTLVQTDIDSSGWAGDSFRLEATGKSYGAGVPFMFLAEGYLYSDTIINYNGIHLGHPGFSTMKIFNNNGTLAFWWPRVSYWNSFEVRVIAVNGSGGNQNRVTSITDSAEPSGATVTKKITVSMAYYMRGDSSAINADTIRATNFRASNAYYLGENNYYFNNTNNGWFSNVKVQSESDMRAPIFYDYNNTAYYLDPSSTSTSLNIAGGLVTPLMWVNYSTSNYNNFNEGIRLYSADNGAAVITFNSTGTTGSSYSSLLGYTDRLEKRWAGQWQERMYNGYTESYGSFRAPIFYDSNDTAYYVDPASTSQLSSLNTRSLAINPDENTSSATTGTLSIWSNPGSTTSSLMFKRTDQLFGTHGAVSDQYATFWNMDSVNRGWIFRYATSTTVGTNVLSIRNNDGTTTIGAGGFTPGNVHARLNIHAGSGSSTLYRDIDLYGGWAGGEGHAITAMYGTDSSNIVGQQVFQHDSPGSRIKWGRLYHSGNQSTYPMHFISDGSSAYLEMNTGSIRAPIFYDSNDTGYYVDPNSTSNSALRMRGGALFGPNTTWGAYLYVGTDGRAGSEATVAVTNGNLHLDSKNGYQMYLNWYSTENIYTQGNMGVGNSSASYRLHVHGTGYSNSDFRAPIFYDSNDTGYYVDPNGTSRLNTVSASRFKNIYDLSTNHGFGLFFGSDESSGYAIYREAGAWDWPYPDLRIAFHTGIKIGANASYQGVKFYTDYDMVTQVMSVNNGSDPLGAGNVFVNYSLQADSSLRAPIFYDSNDTSYYGDFNSLSRMSAIAVENRVHIAESRFLYMGGTATNENSWGSRDWTNGGNRYYNARSHTFNNDGYGSTYSVVINGSGQLTASVDVRAPIFYDSNDTSYYCDPNATSNLNNLTLGGRNMRAFESNSYIEFYVEGDANTYYPVRFDVYAWFHFARWSISRGYGDTAPWDPIGTGAHKGGLTLTWEWSGDGAWGGNDKTIRVIQFAEQYTTMVGGMALSVNGLIVWLRGGNAYYRFHGPGGMMNGVTPYYSTYTAANGSTFSPRSYDSGTVASEVTSRMPVRSTSELYDGGNRVLHLGNYTSYTMARDSWNGNLYFNNDGRIFSTILYDSNDSGYYIDPNSTSRQYQINFNNLYYAPDTSYGFIGSSIYVDTINSGYAGDQLEFNYVRGTWAGISHDSLRAPLYYDYNDTSYYVDPASTSYMNALQSNRYSVGNANPYDEVSSSPWYGLGQSNAAGPWGPNMVQLGGYYGIRHRTAHGVFDIGAPGWGTSWIYSDYNLAVGGQARATVYYDYSDTGYYVDPNGTSNLVGLTVANTITGSITGTAGGETLATVTGRGASTSTSVILSGQGNQFGGHFYFLPYDAAGNHYPHFNDGGNGTGAIVNWRLFTGGTNTHTHAWTTSYTYFANRVEAAGDMRTPIFYDSNNTAYYWDGASTSKWNESNQDGWHTFNNYGLGVTGTYDSYRLQTVFAMGSAYRMAADGASTSNMYGLAWSHPNAGSLGGANNLNDHGLLIINNGSFRAAISSRAVFSADVRGTLFYDYNNTGYYCDPNGTSRLGNTETDQSYTYGWFRNYSNNTGLYNQNTTQHLSSTTNGYWDMSSTTTVTGIRFYTGGHLSALRGYVYADTSNNIGFLNQDGSWRLRVVSGDYSLADGSSMRAQVFYDSNDTNYYVDPASTSILNSVRVASLGVGTAASGTAGEIRATNNITAYYSDDRLKTNLGNITNALEKVMSLNGFYYEANEIAQGLGYKVKREVGLSAQQVEKVLPEIVVPAPIDEKYKTIHYDRIIPLLVEAIKEQQSEIDELKSLVKQLLAK